jgi:hypothetical protein
MGGVVGGGGTSVNCHLSFGTRGRCVSPDRREVGVEPRMGGVVGGGGTSVNCHLSFGTRGRRVSPNRREVGVEPGMGGVVSGGGTSVNCHLSFGTRGRCVSPDRRVVGVEPRMGDVVGGGSSAVICHLSFGTRSRRVSPNRRVVGVEPRAQFIENDRKLPTVLGSKDAPLMRTAQPVPCLVERASRVANEAPVIRIRPASGTFGDIGPDTVGGTNQLIADQSSRVVRPGLNHFPCFIRERFGQSVYVEVRERSACHQHVEYTTRHWKHPDVTSSSAGNHE